MTIDAGSIAAILKHAGIRTTVESYDILSMPEYAVNEVCFVNDDLVLRLTREASGQQRFTREKSLLDELRSIPVVPQVLAGGSWKDVEFQIQTRIDGATVQSQWAAAAESLRLQWVRELTEHVRAFHAIPRATYRIGFYQTAIREWTGTWIDGHDRLMTTLLDDVFQRSPTVAQRAILKRAERFYEDHRDSLLHTSGSKLGHGDLHFLNVLANEQGVTGILDWEWAFGGGVEPEFDLDALIRWSIFPGDFDDESDPPPTADAFACVIPELLRAYPDVAAIPRLNERLTIYQVEHDLHHITTWKPSIPLRPIARLREWIDDRILDQYFESGAA